MTTAYSPGHITCFFCPSRSNNPLATGSRGVGIKTRKGATVTLEERTDSRLEITMDGVPSECAITRKVISALAPSRGFDVTIVNELPVGQGFGMSAAGALASALCACEYSEKGIDEAYSAAHIAEVEGGGGLGDVSAIICKGFIPVRTVPGLPPIGTVVDSKLAIDVNVSVLGSPLNTGATLGNASVSEKISLCGSKSVDEFIRFTSIGSLFSLSDKFSKSTGLETPEITAAIKALSDEGDAGMCMLGHSIFTTVPVDVAEKILGTKVIACPSTNAIPSIIRKA